MIHQFARPLTHLAFLLQMTLGGLPRGLFKLLPVLGVSGKAASVRMKCCHLLASECVRNDSSVIQTDCHSLVLHVDSVGVKETTHFLLQGYF